MTESGLVMPRETPAQNTTARSSAQWHRAYALRLIITDAVVVAAAVFGAQAFWIGAGYPPILVLGRPSSVLEVLAVAAVVTIVWSATLAIASSRERRYLGAGTDEYKRVVDASFRLFAVVLVIAFLGQIVLGRRSLVTAFVLGTLLLLVGRWLWRRWLNRRRRLGRLTERLLVVGSPTAASALVADLRRAPETGYLVVGACVAESDDPEPLEQAGVPILGSLADVHRVMSDHDIDTVAIDSSGRMRPRQVRELSWSLTPGAQHLIVAPGLTDVGGPRLSVRPVAGLPLLHVEMPRFERGQQALKRSVDLVGSAVLLVLLSPVLAIIALAVVAGSPGPALFRQRRVGLDGRMFTMLKFRSMVTGAESAIAELSELDRQEGNEVLFKMRDDPRVTKVGGFIRRFSLDELPQLFNVLTGSMSLVGPRPPLPREVERYEHHVHRRFLMKPGITGLWQVNGRSNLSWEESVRLDLYYVENWSLTGDIIILWRTVRAVLHRDGAY